MSVLVGCVLPPFHSPASSPLTQSIPLQSAWSIRSQYMKKYRYPLDSTVSQSIEKFCVVPLPMYRWSLAAKVCFYLLYTYRQIFLTPKHWLPFFYSRQTERIPAHGKFDTLSLVKTNRNAFFWCATCSKQNKNSILMLGIDRLWWTKCKWNTMVVRWLFNKRTICVDGSSLYIHQKHVSSSTIQSLFNVRQHNLNHTIANLPILVLFFIIFFFQSGFAQYVRLGELIISSTTDDSRPIDLNIIERILHHDYKIPSKYNDIALLKLEHPVTFSQYVRPACLAETFDIPSKTVIATGWGRTEYAEMTSDHLQKVVLDQIVQPSCNASYAPHLSRNLRRGIVEETQFCAGSKLHRDTCQGDSGGPIQIRHSSISCMYTVVGITSFGIRCAETSLPGVYTRVYPYIDWIESIVWPQ